MVDVCALGGGGEGGVACGAGEGGGRGGIVGRRKSRGFRQGWDNTKEYTWTARIHINFGSRRNSMGMRMTPRMSR
eukprot:1380718-Amorphochlora_amoeboformis.AAC.1